MNYKQFKDYVKIMKKLKKTLLIQRYQTKYKSMATAKYLHVILNLCSLGIGFVLIAFSILVLYYYPHPCVTRISPCLYRFTLYCLLASGISLLLVFCADIRREITAYLDVHILAAAIFFVGATGVIMLATFHPHMIGRCMIWKYGKKHSFLIRRFVDLFQNNMECCGATSSSDWLHYGYLPASCCQTEDGLCNPDNIYPYSCIEAVLVKFGPYLPLFTLCFLVIAACPTIPAIIAYKKMRAVNKCDITLQVE